MSSCDLREVLNLRNDQFKVNLDETLLCCRIQEKDESFYRQFHMIICGLDSIVARRWINGMVHSLLQYDTEGQMVQTSMIPMVDGGTEGFKGNARVIMPGHTACIECTLDLFPPQVLRTYSLFMCQDENEK